MSSFFWPSAAVSLFHGLGLAALVVIAYATILSNVNHEWQRRLLNSLLFGAGSVVSMLDPLVVSPGVSVDCRGVFIALAVPFGGIRTGLLSAVMASAFRLWIGGNGQFAGFLGILLSLLAGIIFKRIRSDEWTLKPLDFLMLGALASFASFALLAIPSQNAEQVFIRLFAEIAIAYTAGTFLLGSVLLQIESHLAVEKELVKAAMTDPLTGLANRRHFNAEFGKAIPSHLGSGSDLCLMLIDLDHLKNINDRHGHEVGDAALKFVAETISATIRRTDIAARTGGDEFSVLLNACSLQQAQEFAERLQATLASDGQVGERVTVSIGLAGMAKAGSTTEEMFVAADKALYNSKKTGRNRVEVAPKRLDVRSPA